MAFRLEYTHTNGRAIGLPAIGLDLHVRLPPDVSGGRLTVIETVHGPGFAPPPHRHRETEVFRIITGRHPFDVEGEEFHAEEGGVVSVPGVLVHRFVKVTDHPASLAVS